ncbi:hypothetical protein [Haladaptatus sp. CMSO5]|uniref:hypothetical protein n=1 Tax=Haladaptatus sp. CMSO5 TaxID=3120514 RepID=UPI002FCE3A5F
MVNFGLILGGLVFAGLGVLAIRDPEFFAIVAISLRSGSMQEPGSIEPSAGQTDFAPFAGGLFLFIGLVLVIMAV